ncbi:hypothetical protein RHMOL_Rhmol01G0002400 [Rhododendron molle]|uniref:Uncharacterized protein n=2 Tax=Rhododendron molle TaxID=49168 RepID=A0ACC0PWT0_RHOML|nr:hypothetical protein RHMOL_Rhmol01G0002400 [Rhododendron molle]KAI8570041.1 hypothetical protein RHMOL_Rhmol01G0002400 [Rhododendron molle]
MSFEVMASGGDWDAEQMRLLSSCAEYLSSLLVSMTVSEYFLSSCGGESVTADIAMYIRGIYGMGLLRMKA